jgi:callose synthase
LSGPQPSLRRGLSRAFTMRPEGYSGEDGGEYSEESELVPNSLAPIVPILRAANEIEEENQRVAYLCRFTAFEKAHTMDPNSGGRGVRQFKTYLLHRLEKDEHETQRRLAGTDAKEIQRFYEHYCKKNLVDGLKTKKPEEMARHYQIASVLYDVLKTVTPEKFHAEVLHSASSNYK